MTQFVDYMIEPKRSRTRLPLSILSVVNFANALFCHPMINPLWNDLGQWQPTAWWVSGSILSAWVITPTLVVVVACLVFRGRLFDWRTFAVCAVTSNAALFAWAHIWYLIFTD